MPTIYDLINAKEIGTYYLNSPYNKMPYLGETLFPNKKQLGLDLKWFKGSQGLPVALTPSNFDAKATLRDRVGFQSIETEMPFFREGARVGEKDRQEINKLLASNNYQSYINPILNNIFDDVAKLIEGARVQAERMRMQLLSTGKISIVANRINYDYDYKFADEHKETLTGTAKWDDTVNSKPIDDIMRWMDKVEEDTGVRPTKAICSLATWRKLVQNAQIRADMLAGIVGASGVIVTDSMVKNYLLDKLGLQVAVYNKKFALEDGSAKNYFEDGVFTLIPDGTLGNTWYGTTPEESDLMSGNVDAQVEIINSGIALTTYKEIHPVNVVSIVSAIMLPSFETIDNCFIAKVF